MVVGGNPFLNRHPSQPADNGHQRLKQAEMKAQAKKMPSRQGAECQTGAQGDSYNFV